MLKGKNVLLGVTGGIAAYKAAELASALMKQHAGVDVIETEHATEFITPLTFESLVHTRCITDTFDRNHYWEIGHIALADKADILVIAPATANIIAKLACGIADDMLTTTALACTCPKIIAPAMNTKMYQNPVTQRNLGTLRELGWKVVGPATGYLACGTSGPGKMVEPSVLLDAIDLEIAHDKDLTGQNVLVTAGPTQEAADPVRFLSNHSSGKMGYAIAKAAARRGADVTLISGPTALSEPYGVRTVHVTSAAEMFDAVTSRADAADIVLMAAAVADYRPVHVAANKIKKGSADEAEALPMERTADILAFLGARKKSDQFLCGFSMETENLVENSRKKLVRKNLDLIAANSLREPGAGFQGDTNVLTLISKDAETSLPLLSKDAAADALLDTIVKLRAGEGDATERDSSVPKRQAAVTG